MSEGSQYNYVQIVMSLVLLSAGVGVVLLHGDEFQPAEVLGTVFLFTLCVSVIYSAVRRERQERHSP